MVFCHLNTGLGVYQWVPFIRLWLVMLTMLNDVITFSQRLFASQNLLTRRSNGKPRPPPLGGLRPRKNLLFRFKSLVCFLCFRKVTLGKLLRDGGGGGEVGKLGNWIQNSIDFKFWFWSLPSQCSTFKFVLRRLVSLKVVFVYSVISRYSDQLIVWYARLWSVTDRLRYIKWCCTFQVTFVSIYGYLFVVAHSSIYSVIFFYSLGPVSLNGTAQRCTIQLSWIKPKHINSATERHLLCEFSG